MTAESGGVRRLGLLGRNLSHSFSPQWFQAKFDQEKINGYRYDLYPLADISDWPTQMAHLPQLVGLNVTIPYKQAIIPYLRGLSETAEAIGAVNVLRRDEAGDWWGHNTDAEGFAHSLRPFLTLHHERAIILGRGGAAAAVRHVLQGMGITCVHVVRTPSPGAPWKEVAGEELRTEWARHFPLVVQATPLGTAPATDEMHPFPWEAVGPEHLVVDLVYNPPVSRFLKEAQARGATVLNGQAMLEAQAQAAWAYWTQHP